MFRVASLLIAVCLAAGCARDVRATLPHGPHDLTGTVTVVLTQPARDLTVSVNGVLVAERAHTDKVVVRGVPSGHADVIVAAGGGETRVERHMVVNVEDGKDTAIPIGAPERSMTSAMHLGVLSAAAWVLSRALVLAFL